MAEGNLGLFSLSKIKPSRPFAGDINMTNEEKAQVMQMRSAGIGFARIARELGLSINTVKSFSRREHLQASPSLPDPAVAPVSDPGHCGHCGKILIQKPQQKPRKYCSEQCRRNWWKENSSAGLKRKAYYIRNCVGCGREFMSYGNSRRKFCSHACYITSRYGGRRNHDQGSVRA